MIMMNNMTTMTTTMAMAMVSAMALLLLMAVPTPAEEEGAELVRAAPRREERARKAANRSDTSQWPHFRAARGSLRASIGVG